MSTLFLITGKDILPYEEMDGIIADLSLSVANINHLRIASENNEDMNNNTPDAYINDGSIVRISLTNITRNNTISTTNSIFAMGNISLSLVESIEARNYIIRRIDTGDKLNVGISDQPDNSLFNILINMNDEELLNTCLTNNRINTLCKQHIWKSKLQLLCNDINLIKLLETEDYFYHSWVYMYFTLKDLFIGMDFIVEKKRNINDFIRMVTNTNEFATSRNYVQAKYIVVYEGTITKYDKLLTLLNSLTDNGSKILIKGNIDLRDNKLSSLPESFGNIQIGGHLYLSRNKLTSLPESFGNIQIGGDLYLSDNKLTSLPESFGNLQIGGVLYLMGNQLTSLPDSFGNLQIGGDLYLSDNKLTSLPESFGNLQIGGVLYLMGNQLTSLPESFGNLQIGRGLYLMGNQLTSLPESFGNLQISGDLFLYDNNLTSLPESFGNIQIGGGLYLMFNQLTSLPESFGNIQIGGTINLNGNSLTS